MASFRYWRLSVTRSRYAGSLVEGARDVRFANVSFLMGDYTYAPRMTGDNTPVPLVATASSLWAGASYPAWAAFDGNVSDYSQFISGAALLPEQWLQIDFGAAYDFVAVEIAVDGAGNGYAPVDLRIKGSTTGAFAGEETNVQALTDLTDWAPLTNRLFQWGTFVVPQPVLLPDMLSVEVAHPLEHLPLSVEVLPDMLEVDSPSAYGTATISGTTKVLTALLPNCPVYLLEQHGLRLVRKTVSDGTGAFSFRNVLAGKQYIVMAIDPAGVYNVVAADRITP